VCVCVCVVLCVVRVSAQAKVMCIEDEITRKVITGLVDGSKLPPVEQAFRILYEVPTFHFHKIRKKFKKKVCSQARSL
jgi:hypothetical protein